MSGLWHNVSARHPSMVTIYVQIRMLTFPTSIEVLLNLFVHVPMFSLSSIYLFCLHTLPKEVKNVGSLQGTYGRFPCLPTHPQFIVKLVMRKMNSLSFQSGEVFTQVFFSKNWWFKKKNPNLWHNIPVYFLRSNFGKKKSRIFLIKKQW
jgi:hypothetical protein